MTTPDHATPEVDTADPQVDEWGRETASSAEQEPTGTSSAPRERSTIKFPYTDIRDAVTVASTLNEKLGSSCQPGQLAAAMGQKLTSGSFRTKVATASTFGVVESKRGRISLTPLGHEVVDSRTRESALVKAFLSVDLYRALYDKYSGKSLPGDAGLEAEIRALGVLATQVDRARQAFQRSAEHAGFFWGGKDRLVLPPNGKVDGDDEGPASQDADPGANTDARSGGGGTKLSEAPLLKALWDTLPEGKTFTTEERKRFFTTLAFNIDYVYGPPSDGGKLDPQGVANLWTEKRE